MSSTDTPAVAPRRRPRHASAPLGTKGRSTTPWGSVALVSAVALALGATVFRGGNRHVPLIGLEWLALLVLLGWGLGALSAGRLPEGFSRKGGARWSLWLLAAAPVWVALLQLVVWPSLGAAPPSTLQATWHSTLVGLTMVAMLLMGLSAPPAQTETLLKVWLGAAVAQAAMGLLQLGGSGVLRFDAVSGEPAIGSFASKNTYANFLVMAIPLVIYKLLNPSSGQRSASSRKPWLWGLALLTLLTAVIASTSRTGIATGFLVALLAVVMIPRSGNKGEKTQGSSGRFRLWLVGGALAMLLLALLAGGLDWVVRFDSERLIADDAVRESMREATWKGAMAYWPWGSGIGSYPVVFPRFQSAALGRYLIDLAHSEYLQSLMEMGAAFVVIAAVALALIARRMAQMVRAARSGGRRKGRRQGEGASGGWNHQDTLALACGLGALATALHAWVDYPFRIPANAMFAAFLMGVFLREPKALPQATSAVSEIP